MAGVRSVTVDRSAARQLLEEAIALVPADMELLSAELRTQFAELR
jgi:hypothetical protein